MADAKIEIKIGNINFTGEGDSAWLEKQLDKILNKAEELSNLSPQDSQDPSSNSNHEPADFNANSEIKTKSLSTFLREKNATSNQVEKFLATSVWLETKGKSRLTTGDVTKALKDNSQNRLGNASDSFNKNVSKGFCEKDGTEYFVTQEGKEHIGL